MKAIRTIKLKIKGNEDRLLAVTVSYRAAFNWLSEIVFKSGTIKTPASLSNEFYGNIREQFGLPSQVTCSLFRHVVTTYRTIKSNGHWKQAIYKKLTIPVCWKRDFNFTNKGLTIWGQIISFQSRLLPRGKWSDSKLKLIKDSWYLILTIQVDISEPKTKGSIIGVDSGQKSIFTAVDLTSHKTLYIPGGHLNHRRLQIRQTRAKVASVGTRSAKRLLKRLSGREKAVTQEIIHVASKQLVTFAESVGAKTIVMEDLTGIRNCKAHKKQRARNNRWPFHLAKFCVEYKAEALGIELELVNPAYTSQTCPRCGHVNKGNRNGLSFKCLSCNYADHADRNGAVNIASRLLLNRQADSKRAFVNRLIVTDEGDSSSLVASPCPLWQR